MNAWLIFLIGIIVGGVIGLIITYQNYETCKQHLALLDEEFVNVGKRRQALAEKRDSLRGIVSEKEDALLALGND